MEVATLSQTLNFAGFLADLITVECSLCTHAGTRDIPKIKLLLQAGILGQKVRAHHSATL